ncbi:uncharacterized protein [Eucyclogobius newberryi]|uniref:uncharacterized protein n=1 Tax=Eucyclogobius newberryi TaxID=166745 RepID=UPI003B597CF5
MRPAPRLQLNPDTSQFFKYDSVSLSCSSGDSGPWAVVRNTSRYTRGRCEEDWAGLKDSVCTIEGLFPEDTGLYWCERDKLTSEPVNITVSEHRGTSSTSRPRDPSTSSTAPSTAPPPPFRLSSSDLLVPLVCSGLGLFLLLVLLLLWVKRRKQTPGVRDDARPEEGGASDITYSDVVHHLRRPIRGTEKDESSVYSSVKTEDVCYSSITFNKTKDKGRGRGTNKENEENSVYSTVKTEDVCYSSITFNKTKDPAKRTKKKTRKQNDSSTYAQIKVRTT